MSHFVCTMCGKEHEDEFAGIFHVLAIHNALVYVEEDGKDAISYKDYIKINSNEVEVI
jgi:hypothetical protein